MKPPGTSVRPRLVERAGNWVAVTRKWGPRLVRGLIAEVGRPVAKPRFLPTPAQWNPGMITAAWLGHASVLINFQGLFVLTDPVLSRRVGASWGRRTLGPKRLVAPALTVEQLPAIDVLLLSHAHLDHFHIATLNQLPPGTPVITAAGTADLLKGTRLQNVQELTWGQRTSVMTARHGEISIEAFQVQHWGARWRRDEQRGYNGYLLERNGRKILFAGDTAYCEHFKKLREKGPFELAIMPIGSYKKGTESSHCTPEEAVAMANDAGAHYVLPVHHKTFNFGKESVTEPLERLEKALALDRVALREVGETFSLPTPLSHALGS